MNLSREDGAVVFRALFQAARQVGELTERFKGLPAGAEFKHDIPGKLDDLATVVGEELTRYMRYGPDLIV